MSGEDDYFNFDGEDKKPTENPKIKDETKVVKPEIVKPEVIKPDSSKSETVESTVESKSKDESKEKKTSKPRKPKEPKEQKDSETSIVPVVDTTELNNRIKQLESKLSEMEKKSTDSFENKIKELNAEHQKLEAQMKLMTSFENMIKNLKPNNVLTYYDVDSVVSYVKKQLNLNLEDSQLNSKKKLELLPNWNKFTSEERDMLLVLVRCLRDGKSFEKFNRIQLKMNEEKTH